MFDFAALERRVAALESRAAASLRFGRVTGVEGGQHCSFFAQVRGWTKKETMRVALLLTRLAVFSMAEVLAIPCQAAEEWLAEAVQLERELVQKH